MSVAKQAGLRAQRKAQRPGEILDAAFEEFVERGYVATRVEDIASRVGVTKGTIYFYFETKERLFEEVIRRISVSFVDVSAKAKTLSGPYSQRIRTFLRLVYDRLVTDRNTRELMRFVIAEGSRFPQVVDRHHEEFIVPLMDATQKLFEEGVAAGELRDAPAIKIPDTVIGAAVMLCVSQMIFADRKPQDVEAFFEAHVDLILRGLITKN
ncbi:TetR/AcrR family transcriptional regulator [Rhizobium sp. LEGMi198b]|uniref:TetR/AcrR family transcriptional regulator n=1 Tax=unclassified Rhizobium TaxID=2613769 RepID=UPI000CDF3302|nr:MULTISPECIES: TetR/AcrR family transcriptional regulator [Rhizobium]AVA24768.1 TetR family transcriptional regulator protein [Rhizobium sp. NXC24]MDK4740311.1 TetR/AcrR family transcriptional regulator [Rhizobium sp. CNPSo 3464]UWU24672.1 TetR/AcrR family transcriptional regulator [Rhizobium tropici]WFU05647.1 TetR/AcrR family transcriptional regulator [Rhizobium sp. CB3171]